MTYIKNIKNIKMKEKVNKNQEITAPTFEQIVTTELTKFDAVTPKIEEISAEFMPLKTNGIEDKEAYEEVKKALKVMVTTRNAVEEKRKELKADSLAFGRAVDARAKEITLMLSPIEEHLANEKKKVDEELEEIKRKEQAELQQKISNRHAKLVNAGMVLVGNEYKWSCPTSSESFPSINLETLSDEDFNEYANNINNLNVSEKERIKKENELKEAESKRLAEEAAKIAEQQNKLKQEQEELLQERVNMRLNALTTIGLKISNIAPFVFYEDVSIISTEEIKSLTAADWVEKMNDINERINQIKSDKEKQKEVQEKEAIEKAKIQLAQQQEKERLAEQERLSNMNDKEKYIQYIKKLSDIERPVMKTAKWKKELYTITSLIDINVD